MNNKLLLHKHFGEKHVLLAVSGILLVFSLSAGVLAATSNSSAYAAPTQNGCALVERALSEGQDQSVQAMLVSFEQVQAAQEAQAINQATEAQLALAQQARYVDTDGDGVCDNYGTGRGVNYADANGDGICDNQGSGAGYGMGAGKGQGRNYVDTDGDGVCDNYGTPNSGKGQSGGNGGAYSGNGNGAGHHHGR